MNESFEQQLREYGDKIKEGSGGEFLAEDQSEDINERKIFDLQVEKQRVMRELHEKLSLIDQPGLSLEQRVGGRVKIVKFRDGKYFASSKKDKSEQEITIGDILTAPEWGIRYSFDADSVPKITRKKLQVERAKIELKALLKEQLLINGASNESLPQHIRDTYRRAFGDFVRGEGRKIGLRSEKLVESFLRKLTYDYELGFSVELTDAEDDIEDKIDFIIKHRTPINDVSNVGVQITVNDNTATQEKKPARLQK